MSEKYPYEYEGTVTELLHGAQYRVTLDNRREIVAGLCDRTMIERIHMGIGDRVVVNLKARGKKKPCIVYRRNRQARVMDNATWL